MIHRVDAEVLVRLRGGGDGGESTRARGERRNCSAVRMAILSLTFSHSLSLSLPSTRRLMMGSHAGKKGKEMS